MIAVRPVDVPQLRNEVVRFVAPPKGEWLIYARDLSESDTPIRGLFPGASDKRIAESVAAAQFRSIAEGALFWISAEMAALSVAAAGSLPEFTLTAEDVPTVAGFAYFESPVDVFGDQPGWREQGSPPAVAVAWGPIDTIKDPGLWVTWFTERDSTFDGYLRAGIYGQRDVAQARANMSRVLPHRPLWIPYIDRTDQWGRQPFGLSSNVLKSAWLLMQQPISRVSDAVFDRSTSRRLARDGIESPAVRVITLRRPSNPNGGTDSDREYHHQWIVRGHWRQHWYPARKVHRPVWIAPHVKGPEGAPMLGGEKVYAWKR